MTNISGAIVAKFLYESFITRYGYFTTLKTDSGPEFYNQVIATLVETYGIKHILGTPHYPQSHGFIKRQHQGIIFFLRNYQALILGILSTTLALLGRSHTSEITTIPVPELQLSQDELFAFLSGLINFVNVCIIIFLPNI